MFVFVVLALVLLVIFLLLIARQSGSIQSSSESQSEIWPDADSDRSLVSNDPPQTLFDSVHEAAYQNTPVDTYAPGSDVNFDYSSGDHATGGEVGNALADARDTGSSVGGFERWRQQLRTTTPAAMHCVKPRKEMKPGKSFTIAAAVICAVSTAAAVQSQRPASSSVTLGDKVIVIPNPEGFEEASLQFERIKQVLATMQTSGADTLLLHMPASDCERLKTGSPPTFRHYTKVSVLKSRRESNSSNEDMAGFVAAWRKNGTIMFDPDGPLLKSTMEDLSRQISEAASKQIQYAVNSSQYLGEFDARPDVHSRMVFLTYTKDVAGTQTMRAVVASMTLVKIGPRIINVGVYRNLSSPEAVNTELRPTVIEVKQFTTKWVNEILAANREK